MIRAIHGGSTPFFCVFCFLAACSSETGPAFSVPERAAQQISTELEDGGLQVTPDGGFLNANPTYRAVATSILTTNPGGDAKLIEAARLQSQALDQTLLPQFRPTASVNQDGDPVARLGVTQIVFSNGQFQAEKGALRAGEIEAIATYLVSSNQRVADGITAYLEVDFFSRLTETARDLEMRFQTLVDQAERRVSGGVGDETEIATFRLKLLEAQSDIQTNRANRALAEARLRDLTAGLDLPATPPAMQTVPPRAEPPEVVLLLAEVAAAESDLALERARRRPALSLEAFSETNLSTGTTDDGLSLGVGVSMPLGLKNGLEIDAAEARLTALEAELATTRADLAREVAQLRARIDSETARLAVLTRLVTAARERTDDFEAQFLSGTVSLEEAVSVLDTYRRSQDQLTEARNEVLKAQLDIARIFGQLMPGTG
jgi:outer membrane protein TolC